LHFARQRAALRLETRPTRPRGECAAAQQRRASIHRRHVAVCIKRSWYRRQVEDAKEERTPCIALTRQLQKKRRQCWETERITSSCLVLSLDLTISQSRAAARRRYRFPASRCLDPQPTCDVPSIHLTGIAR
jgi:hypothetical protein